MICAECNVSMTLTPTGFACDVCDAPPAPCPDRLAAATEAVLKTNLLAAFEQSW